MKSVTYWKNMINTIDWWNISFKLGYLPPWPPCWSLVYATHCRQTWQSLSAGVHLFQKLPIQGLYWPLYHPHVRQHWWNHHFPLDKKTYVLVTPFAASVFLFIVQEERTKKKDLWECYFTIQGSGWRSHEWMTWLFVGISNLFFGFIFVERCHFVITYMDFQ